MKKVIPLTFIILCIYSTSNAQTESNYKNAIGIRLSSTIATVSNSISYKHFINKNAIEGLFSFGDGIAIGAMYQIHKPFGQIENLQWFYGGGAYVGINNTYNNNLGALGIIGIDYKFKEIPLNLSVDWKPELNIVTKIGFEASGVGLSARFTF